MRIGFNARILNTPIVRGWSRYAANLLKGFAERQLDIFLFTDQSINVDLVPQLYRDRIVVKKGMNYIQWEQWEQAELAKKYKVDILHCPTNYGLPFLGNFKKILTLHDAIEKSYYDKEKYFFEKFSIKQIKVRGLHYWSQKSADRIITVSENAKEDIIKSYGVNPHKISVIYEAADPQISSEHILSQEEFFSKIKIPQKPFYLYLGGLEKRKNIPYMINLAAHLPDILFVVAGGTADEVKKNKDDILKRKMSNIIFVGPIEEKFISSLYYYCKAFIYPSFHEGFGLQVVEALHMGKPVACANNSSLIEILGDERYGFHPNNVNQGVEIIKKLEDDSFYAQAKIYAQERSQKFSWKKTVEETLNLYKSVL